MLILHNMFFLLYEGFRSKIEIENEKKEREEERREERKEREEEARERKHRIKAKPTPGSNYVSPYKLDKSKPYQGKFKPYQAGQASIELKP
jgi:hypothetical protein